MDILLEFYNITNNSTQNIFVHRSLYTYASILLDIFSQMKFLGQSVYIYILSRYCQIAL